MIVFSKVREDVEDLSPHPHPGMQGIGIASGKIEKERMRLEGK